MAYKIGNPSLWVFLDNDGAPAVGGTAYFYRNTARSTRKEVFPDQSATAGTGQSELSINGQGRLEWDEIFFNDDEAYYIHVLDADGDEIASIANYTPAGGTGTYNNYSVEENCFANAGFDYHKTGSFTQTNVTSATPFQIAPPNWYYRRTSTVAPTESLEFVTNDGSGLAVTQIGASTTRATPSYYFKYAVTSVGTVSEKIVYFRFPSVKTFSNKQITISADMRRGTGTDFNVKFFYIQDYGSGGSGEQTLVDIGTDKTITTSWQRFNASVTVANVLTSGLTIDTARTDSILVGVNITGLLAAVGELHITNLALYVGDVTDMDYRTQYIENAFNLPRPSPVADPTSSNRSADEGKTPIANQYGYYDLTDITQLNRNLIWGGDFTVNPWQEGTGARTLAAAASASQYITDGYKLDSKDGAGTAAFAYSHQQSSEAPTLSNANYYTANSLYVQLTAGAKAIPAGDLMRIEHVIEGYDFKYINQQAFTIGFWVKSSVAGTYCVALSNSGDNLAYIHEYTISAINTWEFKSFNVPAYSGGMWNFTNGVGLRISWTFVAGSTYTTGTANKDAWTALSSVYATDAISNWAASGTPTIQLALPQLHLGSTLPNFPVQFPGEQLRKAQRYYQKSYDVGTEVGTATQSNYAKGIAVNTSTSVNSFYPQLYFYEALRDVPDCRIWDLSGAVNRVNDANFGGSFSFPGTAGAPTAGGTPVVTFPNLTRTHMGHVTLTAGTGTFGTNLTRGGNILFHWEADKRF